MRSKKIEAGIKTCEGAFLQVVGTDFTGQPIEKFTNKNNTVFCPYLDHERLAQVILKARGDNVMHREYPVSSGDTEEWKRNSVNKQNLHYHWVQIGFNSVQFCQLQEQPVDRNSDLCEKHFKKCHQYLMRKSEE